MLLICNPFFLGSAALNRLSVDPGFLEREEAKLLLNFTALQAQGVAVRQKHLLPDRLIRCAKRVLPGNGIRTRDGNAATNARSSSSASSASSVKTVSTCPRVHAADQAGR
jgi:hypothetical protein